VNDTFEAQIKKYTEQLAADSNSRVFVPLAEIYRKLGRYEEAISVAQDGLKHHPNYMGGKTALARAYFENGKLEQAQELLESILQLAPDNLLANRLLSELFVEKGEPNLAVPVLKQLVAMEPNDARAAKQLADLEARLSGAPQLESQPSPHSSPHPSSHSPAASSSPKPPVQVKPPGAPLQQPQQKKRSLPSPSLSPATISSAQKAQPSLPQEPKKVITTQTQTLANLYRSQGHLDKAIEVYQELLKENPGNKSFMLALKQTERELGEKIKINSGTNVEFLKTLMVRIQKRRRAY